MYISRWLINYNVVINKLQHCESLDLKDRKYISLVNLHFGNHCCKLDCVVPRKLFKRDNLVIKILNIFCVSYVGNNMYIEWICLTQSDGWFVPLCATELFVNVHFCSFILLCLIAVMFYEISTSLEHTMRYAIKSIVLFNQVQIRVMVNPIESTNLLPTGNKKYRIE